MPHEHLIQIDSIQADLKFDVRACLHDGKVYLLATCIRAGQATKFRTSGGGLAPVAVVPQVDKIDVLRPLDRLAHDLYQDA